jgi:predicted metal-dependent hydrolase
MRVVLPSYNYIPGGPWPHPTSDPRGHAFGQVHRPAPIPPSSWWESPDYLRGVELFNAGFYWEAHEAWEGLWHAHGRTGATADLLKGLIKLAAAGLKVRQAQWHGVLIHLHRAADSLRSARQAGGPHQLGLDLDGLLDQIRSLGDDPPSSDLPLDAPAANVLGLRLIPS